LERYYLSLSRGTHVAKYKRLALVCGAWFKIHNLNLITFLIESPMYVVLCGSMIEHQEDVCFKEIELLAQNMSYHSRLDNQRTEGMYMIT
jgi:hypothetical protein